MKKKSLKPKAISFIMIQQRKMQKILTFEQMEADVCHVCSMINNCFDIGQSHTTETCWGPVWRPNSQQTWSPLKATWWVPQLQLETRVEQKCLFQPSEPQVAGGWGPHRQRPLKHYWQTDTPSGSRTGKTSPGSVSSVWQHLLRASHTLPAADRSHTGEYVPCCGLHWATGSRRWPALGPEPRQPTLLLSG